MFNNKNYTARRLKKQCFYLFSLDLAKKMFKMYMSSETSGIRVEKFYRNRSRREASWKKEINLSFLIKLEWL